MVSRIRCTFLKNRKNLNRFKYCNLVLSISNSSLDIRSVSVLLDVNSLLCLSQKLDINNLKDESIQLKSSVY